MMKKDKQADEPEAENKKTDEPEVEINDLY